MQQKKINQRKIGVILTYLSQGVMVLTGLLYTPIMLKLLGQSEYGLYQLVNSIVSYLSILSLGFSASYMRFFSRYKALKKEKEIARLNGMFLTIFVFISLVCILCGVIMLVNIEEIFGQVLTNNEYQKARVLLALMVINMAITFPDSVFDCQTTAYERFFFQKFITLLKYLLNPFLCLPLLIMGFGSVALITVSLFLTIFKFIIDIWFCIKKLHIRFYFK